MISTLYDLCHSLAETSSSAGMRTEYGSMLDLVLPKADPAGLPHATQSRAKACFATHATPQMHVNLCYCHRLVTDTKQHAKIQLYSHLHSCQTGATGVED